MGRIADSPAGSPLAWRDVCRQEAEAQAVIEARAAWGMAGDTPFNHRWEHVQRVVQVALWLAGETGADREVTEAAAWLHDIRKGDPDHGPAGAIAAAAILARTDYPTAKIPLVADAIRRHAGLFRAEGAPPLEPLEVAVLWDADKLTKLGVEALAYTLSSPYERGKTLLQRRQDMLTYVITVLARSVASMNTEAARRLARQRYAAMTAMLQTWAQEERIGDP